MPDFEVVTPLKIPGQRKPAPPGAIVSLDEDEGEELARIGALRRMPYSSAAAVAVGESSAAITVEAAKEMLEQAGYVVLSVEGLAELVTKAGDTAVSVYQMGVQASVDVSAEQDHSAEGDVPTGDVPTGDVPTGDVPTEAVEQTAQRVDAVKTARPSRSKKA